MTNLDSAQDGLNLANEFLTSTVRNKTRQAVADSLMVILSAFQTKTKQDMNLPAMFIALHNISNPEKVDDYTDI